MHSTHLTYNLKIHCFEAVLAPCVFAAASWTHGFRLQIEGWANPTKTDLNLLLKRVQLSPSLLSFCFVLLSRADIHQRCSIAASISYLLVVLKVIRRVPYLQNWRKARRTAPKRTIWNDRTCATLGLEHSDATLNAFNSFDLHNFKHHCVFAAASWTHGFRLQIEGRANPTKTNLNLLLKRVQQLFCFALKDWYWPVT